MKKHEVIVYEIDSTRTLLSIHEISRFVGIHPEKVRRLFTLGLIDPEVERPEPLFEEQVLNRIEKILRLHHNLGVNFSGCGVVLDLLEKIADLESQLRYYQDLDE